MISVVMYGPLTLVIVVAPSVPSKFRTFTPSFNYAEVCAVSSATSLDGSQNNFAAAKAVEYWHGGPDHSLLRNLNAQYCPSNLYDPACVQI